MMSEEKLIKIGYDTQPLEFWELYVTETKQDSDKIHTLIHKHGLGKGRAGENIVDILCDEYESLRAIIARQQQELAIAADLLAEERAKVAHRDELLRIQGEACERYKAALEEIKLTPLCNSPAYSLFSKAQMRQENLDMFRVAVKALEESETE